MEQKEQRQEADKFIAKKKNEIKALGQELEKLKLNGLAAMAPFSVFTSKATSGCPVATLEFKSDKNDKR